MTATTPADIRIDWVDYAKGICIILVVMMHSTLGVAAAMGEPNWLNGFIAWASAVPHARLLPHLGAVPGQPHRPALARLCRHQDHALRLLLPALDDHPDRAERLERAGRCLGRAAILAHRTGRAARHAVVHLRADPVLRHGQAGAPCAGLDRLPVAAALELAPIHTGWIAVDEFAGRFVYFYTGYVAARWIMSFASGVSRVDAPSLLAFLATWAVVNLWAVQSGLAFAPVLSMLFGYAGCAAVITSHN
jgi:hypothetical protein